MSPAERARYRAMPYSWVATVRDGGQVATTIVCDDRRKLLDFVCEQWLGELVAACRPHAIAWLEHERPNAAIVRLYGLRNNLSVEIRPARRLV